ATDRPIVQLIGVGHVVIPLIAVVLPRDLALQKAVTDATSRRRRNRKYGVVFVCVRVGIFAVAEVARVVIIEKIVMAHFTVRIDGMRKGLQVAYDGRNSGLLGIRT